jgi:peptide/nickel transport system permease protein
MTAPAQAMNPMAAVPTGAAKPASTRRPIGRLVSGYLPALVVVIIAIVGPYLTRYSPTDVVGQGNLVPSALHWFGTDSSGMDVFARTFAAFRYDVPIGLAAAVLSTVVGIIIGIVIGTTESLPGAGGWIGRGVGRLVDLLQALPVIVLSLAIVAFFGSTPLVLIIAIGLVLMPGQARVVRSEVLKVRTEAYVEAGRVSGFSEVEILVRHILPNSSWPALENASLMFGSSILIVGALGFLGVGLPIPTPEWGSMISIGAPAAAVGRWWSALFPALALAFSVFALSIAGHRFFSPATPARSARKKKSSSSSPREK